MNNDSENNYDQSSSINLIINNFDKKLDFWFLVITIPLGILLNMISIYIYSRPNLNKTNLTLPNLTLPNLKRTRLFFDKSSF